MVILGIVSSNYLRLSMIPALLPVIIPTLLFIIGNPSWEWLTYQLSIWWWLGMVYDCYSHIVGFSQAPPKKKMENLHENPMNGWLKSGKFLGMGCGSYGIHPKSGSLVPVNRLKPDKQVKGSSQWHGNHQPAPGADTLKGIESSERGSLAVRALSKSMALCKLWLFASSLWSR